MEFIKDVVPFYKNLKSKNVIAIIIDHSEYSERAFEWLLKNFVPGFSPSDTRFIIFCIITTSTVKNDLIKGNQMQFFAMRNIFADVVIESSRKLNLASYTDENGQIQTPGIAPSPSSVPHLPSYSEIPSDVDHDKKDPFHGIDHPGAAADDETVHSATKKHVRGMTIPQLSRPEMGVDPLTMKRLVDASKCQVMVVRNDEFVKAGEAGYELSEFAESRREYWAGQDGYFSKFQFFHE
ncbi:hypothetical protein HDU76_001375 [Blyttiomyces sp. JEL0837]|nr:hypothetical protein HDU76_001375 [Blyttiomyces sp. JEL0837]